MIGVAAVVAAVALGVAYYLHSRSSLPPRAPAAAQTAAPAPPAEPAIQHPVPPSDAAPQGPLPSLGDSDPAIRDALGEVAGSNALMQYLVPDSIIRHIVVTIDNLPRQKVPVEKRPTVAVAGTFLAVGDELHATLDPRNFARYEPMVGVVRNLDMQRLAAGLSALLSAVPAGLSEPRLSERLLQRPAGPGRSTRCWRRRSRPVPLSSPGRTSCTHIADPTLEARPAGQKLLLRMGPDNAAVVKAKLTELRAIITAAPPPKR